MAKDREMTFPMNLRRLRQNRWIRDLTRETRVSLDQLVQPIFAVEDVSAPEAVPGMTGVMRETPDSLLRTIERDLEAGVKKFLLFGVPSARGESGFQGEFTSQQIHAIKSRFKDDLLLMVDVCLCSLTKHGHCGVLSVEGDHIDNSASVEELARLGLHYAQAGADCVAPSDMMDGRIAGIRKALDQVQDDRTLIMSYSAKFSSKFYGPFRAAADCAPQHERLRDRASYQIDPGNYSDAYQSSIRDAQEGADILMVKPGMPYLDVLSRLSSEIQKPWAVYEVSGEYAGVELLAQAGLMQGPAAHVEAWTGFVRAGASIIITYGARYARKFLEGA